MAGATVKLTPCPRCGVPVFSQNVHDIAAPDCGAAVPSYDVATLAESPTWGEAFTTSDGVRLEWVHDMAGGSGYCETGTPDALPSCDGARGCPDAVTHIGSDGYVYCPQHAQWRRDTGAERTRRMRAWELDMIRAGKPLPSYTAGRKPAEVTR